MCMLPTGCFVLQYVFTFIIDQAGIAFPLMFLDSKRTR